MTDIWSILLEYWESDADSIVLVGSMFIFIFYSFFAYKFLSKKENLILLTCGVIQFILSPLIEPIGWLTGLWEFGWGRNTYFGVLLEGFYAGLLFFSFSLFIGIVFLYCKKKRKYSFFVYLVMIGYILFGWYMDVVVGHYSRPLLVLFIWIGSILFYRCIFIYFYNKYLRILSL